MLLHTLRHSRDDAFQRLQALTRRRLLAGASAPLLIGAALLDVLKTLFDSVRDPIQYLGGSFQAYLLFSSVSFFGLALIIVVHSTINGLRHEGTIDNLLLAGYGPRGVLAPVYADVFSMAMAVSMLDLTVQILTEGDPGMLAFALLGFGMVHVVCAAALTASAFIAMSLLSVRPWVQFAITIAFNLALLSLLSALSDWLSPMLAFYYSRWLTTSPVLSYLTQSGVRPVLPMNFGIWGGFFAAVLVEALALAALAAAVSLALPRILRSERTA